MYYWNSNKTANDDCYMLLRSKKGGGGWLLFHCSFVAWIVTVTFRWIYCCGILKKLSSVTYSNTTNITPVSCKPKILNNGCCMSAQTNNLRTSPTLAIPGNNVPVFILYPELVCFWWCVPALHANSQKTILFFMHMDGTIAFNMFLCIAGGEAQLVTSTGQFPQPLLVQLWKVHHLTDFFPTDRPAV